ncbi:hypothetical protein, conserved [Leishmania donovani]|uniref:Exportin-1/Importin-beta-like domain-containing protein n=1 Tax=Leishmania donovani TaxID=5661 RepID=A0A3S7WVU2_LEIDO|nr:hypothetical protein, conserved [Leishmania donovani]AYU78303.1 hypothetical protein LdCL_200007200 [Leishmania donovani]TPP49969.1 hypothetical protein CGC21_29675 [Leishmania donovani]CBZ33657.1 hypothetical protein, conserved [Leishmania donovani]
MSSGDGSVAAAVAAVVHFTTHGDTASNQELMHAIDHSLDAGCTPAAHTIAPQLLRWALEDSTACVSAGIATYVGVLNRHFCVQVIPHRLAQPLDRRPTGLEELLQLYVMALHSFAIEASRRQLTQCVACLLILIEDSLVDRLRAWVRGGDAASADECRTALQVFIAVVDLLADRRVAIGSIRRATQRRQLQEHLLIALESPLTDRADLPLLVHATDAAVRFLLEAMYGEPQEVAATFWEALPTSTVWQHCLRCLGAAAAASSPPATCPEEVLNVACNVLRCQTIVNAAAEALLSGALPLVLQPIAPSSAATVDWETISRVISAAVEASTKAIVTQQPSDAPLFQLFSSAADRLAQLLQAPAAPATAVCHVCEGISALTQALQPTPLPELEPDDDPDDFADFVEQTHAVNAEKSSAVAKLRPFLHECTRALAARLTHSKFAQEEWRNIAEYVARQVAEGDTEDYEVAHDGVHIAVFTTYERLTALLGALGVEEINTAAPELGQRLVLVMRDSSSALHWLESIQPADLLVQSALLPCCVARHVSSTSATGWAIESAAVRVMDVLVHALATYQEHGLHCSGGSASGSVPAIMDVTRATAAVALAIAGRVGPDNAAHLRERITPLVSALWQCVTSAVGAPASALTHHAAADELATLLEARLAVLPDAAVDLLKDQDAYTQAVLFATGGASTPSLNTLEALAHTLHCIAQLSSEEAEAAETRVCRGLVERLRRHCEAGEWAGEALATLLDSWHAQHPQLLLCFLTLSVAVPAELQPALLLAGITRFFSLPQSCDTSTRELSAALEARFVRPIAASPATAPSLHALVVWLSQPHPSFTAADGVRRVRALAECGRALCEGGHVPVLSLTETLVTCVARWQEHKFASALGGGEADAVGEKDDTEGDVQLKQEVLKQLAMWSRCVSAMSGLPPSAPPWLARLQSAQDDYERMEVLKSV